MNGLARGYRKRSVTIFVVSCSITYSDVWIQSSSGVRMVVKGLAWYLKVGFVVRGAAYWKRPSVSRL